MRRLGQKWWGVSLSAAVVALAGAVVFVAGATGSSGAPSAANAATSRTAANLAANPIASALREDYAIFSNAPNSGQTKNAVGDSSATAQDSPADDPAAAAAADGYQGVAHLLAGANSDPSDSLGLDPAAAQEVTVGSTKVWAIPGSRGACVVIPSPIHPQTSANEVCGTLAAMDRDSGLLSSTFVDPATDTVTHYGLAPDSMGTTADVAGQQVSVQNNLFIQSSHSTSLPDGGGGAGPPSH